ncbi:GntR family transcriptional regulator [Nocardia sp. NPDC046763]|uniref:GntR family transcriptional regulator n=1 Tax=Nocardia sp. NPDC046763 TaxID=3155256 RepID=UPI0033E9277B
MSTSLPKAARRGLAQEAADLIRSAILAGDLALGAPLREVELAAALGISRGSVREGLAVLEGEGLIRRGWHRGTSVIDIAARDIEEVYTLRAALDRLAALTAHRVATPEQFAALDELVDRMAAGLAAQAPTARLLALDIAFHDRIYAAAGNERLRRAWEAVRSQVHLFQLHRVTTGDDHYRAHVVDEHRELAALLRSGDPDALARCAEEHVDAARRSLLADLPA